MTWKTPEFVIPRDGFYIVPSDLELFEDDNSGETESGAYTDHTTRGHDSIHDDMNMSAMITWSRGVHSHDPKYHTMNNSSS